MGHFYDRQYASQEVASVIGLSGLLPRFLAVDLQERFGGVAHPLNAYPEVDHSEIYAKQAPDKLCSASSLATFAC